MAMEPGTRATDEEYVDYSSDKYCEESDHGSPPCFVDGTHAMKLGISGRGPAIFEEPQCIFRGTAHSVIMLRGMAYS